MAPAIVGMRQGGRRRILVPPEYGWVNDKIQVHIGFDLFDYAIKSQACLMAVKLTCRRCPPALGFVLIWVVTCDAANPRHLWRQAEAGIPL